MLHRPRTSGSRARWQVESNGASLIEALVSIAILTAVAAGAAHLFVWARRATWTAGSSSIAVTLAIQKMEQLQSLAWTSNREGNAVSDTTTDLSTDPRQSGGGGVMASPGSSLSENTPGFVDYLDAGGRWRGTGTVPPDGSAFVRRWSIKPLPTDPQDTIVLTVLVIPLAHAVAAERPVNRGARLTTVRTRVAP